VKLKYLSEPAKKEDKSKGGGVLDVRETVPVAKYNLPVRMDKPYHQPHLENFFDAIRGRAKLNCPAEVGYETAATVLKANEAVEAARKLDFKPEEFEV
ncbi:MAG: Gfo/Idh/MocA family protein, partial [Planctomycetota bacterium]